MIIPPEYLKKKSKTIPFGYETSEITGYFKPIPEQLEVLNKYLTLIKEKKCSLREASTLIEQETGRKLSHVSLKNYTDKGPSLETRRKKNFKEKTRNSFTAKEKLTTKRTAA